MDDFLSRAFAVDLEIRSDGTGRTIEGIVVPFDREAMVSDNGRTRYPEMFRRGAFAKSITERGDRVKLLAHHQSGVNPLGRASLLREDPAGLWGEFRVSRTAAGDEVLELVRDGALDSFSVGFTPIKHVRQDRTVVRTEVALREVSIVTLPAYEDARIAAVRMLSPEDRAELAQMLRDSIDLSTTHSEPADPDTSTEAVLSDHEPPAEALRGLSPQQRLTIVRAAFATRSVA